LLAGYAAILSKRARLESDGTLMTYYVKKENQRVLEFEEYVNSK